MTVSNSGKKPTKKISWKKDIDPETEDRLEYLKLSPEEKWNYLMALVLSNYPAGKKVTYKKRLIEWK